MFVGDVLHPCQFFFQVPFRRVVRVFVRPANFSIVFRLGDRRVCRLLFRVFIGGKNGNLCAPMRITPRPVQQARRRGQFSSVIRVPRPNVFRGTIRGTDSASVSTVELVKGRTTSAACCRICFRSYLADLVWFVCRNEVLRHVRFWSGPHFFSHLYRVCLVSSASSRFQRRVGANCRRALRFKFDRFFLWCPRWDVRVVRGGLIKDRRAKVDVCPNDLLVRVSNASVDVTTDLFSLFIVPRCGHRLNVRFRSQCARGGVCPHPLRRLNNDRVIFFIGANLGFCGGDCFFAVLHDDGRHVSGGQIFHRPVLNGRSLLAKQIVGNLVRRVSRVFGEVVERVRRRVLLTRVARCKFFLVRAVRYRKAEFRLNAGFLAKVERVDRVLRIRIFISQGRVVAVSTGYVSRGLRVVHERLTIVSGATCDACFALFRLFARLFRRGFKANYVVRRGVNIAECLTAVATVRVVTQGRAISVHLCGVFRVRRMGIFSLSKGFCRAKGFTVERFSGVMFLFPHIFTHRTCQRVRAIIAWGDLSSVLTCQGELGVKGGFFLGRVASGLLVGELCLLFALVGGGVVPTRDQGGLVLVGTSAIFRLTVSDFNCLVCRISNFFLYRVVALTAKDSNFVFHCAGLMRFLRVEEVCESGIGPFVRQGKIIVHLRRRTVIRERPASVALRVVVFTLRVVLEFIPGVMPLSVVGGGAVAEVKLLSSARTF